MLIHQNSISIQSQWKIDGTTYEFSPRRKKYIEWSLVVFFPYLMTREFMTLRVSGRCVFCGLAGSLATNSKLYKNIREDSFTKNRNFIPNLQQYPGDNSILSQHFVQLVWAGESIERIILPMMQFDNWTPASTLSQWPHLRQSLNTIDKNRSDQRILLNLNNITNN